MQEAITEYFAKEKIGALVLLALGLGALAAMALLLHSSYCGALIPLGLIAALQLAIGGAIYLRTDRQVAELRAKLERHQAEFKTVERARMRRILRTFKIVEVAEVVLLLFGIALALLCKQQAGLFAAGLGLIWQTGVMLVFDLLADRRSQQYFHAIERLIG